VDFGFDLKVVDAAIDEMWNLQELDYSTFDLGFNVLQGREDSYGDTNADDDNDSVAEADDTANASDATGDSMQLKLKQLDIDDTAVTVNETESSTPCSVAKCDY